jgi:hypothetical protein
VGSIPTSAGGKSTGPKKKAGTPTAAVTNATFVRIFTISSPSSPPVLRQRRRGDYAKRVAAPASRKGVIFGYGIRARTS